MTRARRAAVSKEAGLVNLWGYRPIVAHDLLACSRWPTMASSSSMETAGWGQATATDQRLNTVEGRLGDIDRRINSLELDVERRVSALEQRLDRRVEALREADSSLQFMWIIALYAAYAGLAIATLLAMLRQAT